MKHLKTPAGCYTMLCLLFTLLGTVGQSLALRFGYDCFYGVYRTDSSIGTVVAWCLFAFVILLSSALLILPKDKQPDEIAPCGNGLAFFSSVGGVASICTSLLVFLDVMQQNGAIKTLSLLLLLFSLPTGAYLILSALSQKKEDKLLTVLGFFPVIWLALCLVRIYFDRTSAINDPMQILLQISLAAIMLYFLTELRARVGKPGSRLRLVAGMTATLLGSASSVSIIFLYISLQNGKNGSSLLGFRTVITRGECMLAVFELLLSFYIIGRWWTFDQASSAPLPVGNNTDGEAVASDEPSDEAPSQEALPGTGTSSES